MKGLLKLSLFLFLFLLGNVVSYSQVRKSNTRASLKRVAKPFYATLNLGAGYANHLSVPLYSQLGVDAKIARHLKTQNVYKAEELITSDPFSWQWCKLFSLDGKFLGYISRKNIIECKAPQVPQFEMVHVKGGTFMMGDNTDPKASPEHQVTVSDFEICKFEVLPDQWNMIFGGKGIIHVSWNDVQNFITILNRLTKKNYRLPTEAEWEYAAKGGLLSRGCKYSGSDTATVVAWYDKNTDLKGYKMMAPGSKRPNELGIYDMSGNLWEFCQDYYDYYPEEPQINPVCKNNKSGEHVMRGGGVGDEQKCCTTTYRGKVSSDWVTKYLGFRLVLSSPQKVSSVKTKK